MTEPIYTTAQALEAAARITDEEATYWAQNCNDAERVIWEEKSAAIRALSARIAAPVAVVKPQDGPERLGFCGACNRVHMLHCSDPEHCGHAAEYIRSDLAAQPDMAALIDALRQSAIGWENLVELKLIPKRHEETAIELARVSRAALTIQPAAQAVAEAVAKVTAERDELQHVVDAAGKKILHLIQKEREAVAGAYLAAANEIDCGCENGVCKFEHACPRADVEAVLAMLPADATAALARRDAEVRNEALREAADAAHNHLASVDCYEDLVSSHLEDAILALIDKEPAHD